MNWQIAAPKPPVTRGTLIVLEGSIAAGKTTLAFALRDYLSALGHKVLVMLEPIQKEFLNLYQSAIGRYAFPFQSVMARERIQTYREALRQIDAGVTVIMDRSLVGDLAFAVMQRDAGHFTDAEWQVYNTLIGLNADNKDVDRKFMSEAIIIYLDVTPQVSFERMLQRAIESEVKAYTLDYFQKLDIAYEEAIQRVARYNRVVWDVPQRPDAAVCKTLLGDIPALTHLTQCV